MELNFKFNRYIDKKGDSIEIINFIKNQIDIINNILNKFKEKYDLEFLKSILAYYESLDDKAIVLNIPKEKRKQIEELHFEDHINKLNIMFEKSNKNSKANYAIYSENEIIKKLNPTNEICYELMNK